MAKRRRKGNGTIFYSRGQALWKGAYEVPTPRDAPRRRRIVSSTLFCHMLKKYSELPHTPVGPAQPRKQKICDARAKGTHTEGEWFAKLRAQDNACFYCGQQGYKGKPRKMFGRWVRMPGLVMDHMTPVSRGGSDHIDNLVGACEPCNQCKSAMTADEYIAYLERRRIHA